jgi:topoisomerase-4 subunit A
VNFLSDNPKSELLLITDTVYPRIKVTFGGVDERRESIEIEVEEFIGVKGIKAKGKRIHTWEIKTVEEIEPLHFPEKEEQKDEQKRKR